MEEQKPKRNYKQEEKYKWRKSVVLTPKEGDQLETILTNLDCDSVSQLCKKIIKGELSLERIY